MEVPALNGLRKFAASIIPEQLPAASPASAGDTSVRREDARFMQIALGLARDARALDEVPVGAVLVRDGEVIGRGHNRAVSDSDPTAHAEIEALRQAARVDGNYRLPGTTLYVTIEPCAMCVGAMIHARVERLVFGAREPRAGAVLSRESLAGKTWLNHRIEVAEGVLAEECGALLTEFFARKRASRL